MSGYDLIVVTEGSVGKFWSMSRAGIYRELARLERLHLVTGADVAQEGRPDKRIYELTTSGRQAFEGWFETTSVDEEGRKLGFLVKFFFARHMRTPLLAQLLTEVANETQRKLDSLVAQHERLDAPGVRFGRLAARHGILAMEARLAWIAEARRDLGLEADPALTLLPQWPPGSFSPPPIHPNAALVRPPSGPPPTPSAPTRPAP